MENKIYYETDDIGTHKVIEYPSGRKIRLLKNPSESYLAKIKNRNESINIANENRRIEKEKEKLIQSKMRELAIAELQKEGKL